MHRWITRACVTTGTLTALGLLAAGTASAHVTANSPNAAQGGYAVITFQAPNESPKATTTGLTVTLPPRAPGDTTLSSVRTTAIPGWTATVAKDPATSAPTSVTWTAAPGTSIGADQFGQFQLSVGKLPTAATLSLPATQTYSDGSVVKWDEQPKADGSEPDHPVPTLKLAAAGDTHGQAIATSSAASAQPAVSATGTDSTARWLGGAGLVLGALGLAVGGGVALGSRRRS
ncbi:MAG: YcnI family protein [Mycobacteriaceae bacterium]